jgi:hypothetical protein
LEPRAPLSRMRRPAACLEASGVGMPFRLSSSPSGALGLGTAASAAAQQNPEPAPSTPERCRSSSNTSRPDVVDHGVPVGQPLERSGVGEVDADRLRSLLRGPPERVRLLIRRPVGSHALHRPEAIMVVKDVADRPLARGIHRGAVAGDVPPAPQAPRPDRVRSIQRQPPLRNRGTSSSPITQH